MRGIATERWRRKKKKKENEKRCWSKRDGDDGGEGMTRWIETSPIHLSEAKKSEKIVDGERETGRRVAHVK